MLSCLDEQQLGLCTKFIFKREVAVAFWESGASDASGFCGYRRVFLKFEHSLVWQLRYATVARVSSITTGA